jgi:hypothetical protein
MSRNVTASLIVLALFPAICGPLFAHHGLGGYDTEHPIVLRGTVTAFAWENPHVQIDLDAKDDNGNVEHWACIAASPAGMSKFGWTRNSLKPGDQIALGLQPAKDGTHTGAFIKVLLNGELVGNSKQQPDH